MGKVLSFELRVGKVQMGSIIGGFTVISLIYIYYLCQIAGSKKLKNKKIYLFYFIFIKNRVVIFMLIVFQNGR